MVIENQRKKSKSHQKELMIISQDNQPTTGKINGLDQDQGHLGLNIDMTKKEIIKTKCMIQEGKTMKIQGRGIMSKKMNIINQEEINHQTV